MEDQEKLYIKGFNNGYLIAEHEPELAAQLVRNKNSHSEYFKGVVSGKQEFDMEKIRGRVREASRNIKPDKDISKDKGKER